MNSNPTNGSPLRGARILVVEDEWMISTLIAELLTECGCKVVGPASSVAEAVGLASTEAIDASLLDLNVHGEVVDPVARTLADRGIPFVFLTGYRSARVSETYRERPVLQKPVRPEKLIQILSQLLSQSVK
jgi:CheY-like chemotaxis protein